MKRGPLTYAVAIRGLLTAAGHTILLAGLSVASDAPAAGQGLAYSRVEVAPGVHLFEAPDQGAGHIVLIASESEGLVIDSGTSPVATESVTDAAFALGVRSLKGVVYTHWHMDHVLGTQSFLARFPGTPVIAPSGAETMLRTEVAPDLAQQIARIRDRLESWDQQLASGKTPAGEALDTATRATMEQRRAMFGELLQGFEVVELVYPTETFGERRDLRVGALTVELMLLGPAHSSTDVGVRVVEPGVFVAGDVVTLPYPAAAEGFSSIEGWRDALSFVQEQDFDILIPGHGPVQRDRVYVDDLATLLFAITEQVDAAQAMGDTPELIAEELDVTWWIDRHLGEDPRLRAGFDALFLDPAVRIVSTELSARDR